MQQDFRESQYNTLDQDESTGTYLRYGGTCYPIKQHSVAIAMLQGTTSSAASAHIRVASSFGFYEILKGCIVEWP